jgi:hypothetical protein
MYPGAHERMTSSRPNNNIPAKLKPRHVQFCRDIEHGSGIVASLESAEALKILTGSPDVNRELVSFDIWRNRADSVSVRQTPDCPVCASGQYEMLGRRAGINATVLFQFYFNRVLIIRLSVHEYCF